MTILLLSLSIFNKYTVSLVFILPLIVSIFYIKEIISFFKNGIINENLEVLTSEFKKIDFLFKLFILITIFLALLVIGLTFNISVKSDFKSKTLDLNNTIYYSYDQLTELIIQLQDLYPDIFILLNEF